MPKSVRRALPSQPMSTLWGRDVAMDDAERLALVVVEHVRGLEPGERVERDAHREARVDGAPDGRELLADVGERRALDVVHDDEGLAVVEAELAHLHDVVVLDRRREARLVDEHREEALVGREVPMRSLDGDQRRVTRRRPCARGTRWPCRRTRARRAARSCRIDRDSRSRCAVAALRCRRQARTARSENEARAARDRACDPRDVRERERLRWYFTRLQLRPNRVRSLVMRSFQSRQKKHRPRPPASSPLSARSAVVACGACGGKPGGDVKSPGRRHRRADRRRLERRRQRRAARAPAA